MDRNSIAQPMDYTYQNGRGPVDENSPFITATRNSQHQHSSFREKSRGDLPSSFHLNRDIDIAKSVHKRPFSSTQDSPAKGQGSGSSSSFPSLAPAAGQRTLFSDLPPPPPSSSQKALPNLPPSTRSRLDFTTPRKLEYDFSSGGETPDTVDNNADNEATPDNTVAKSNMGLRKNLMKVFSGSSNKPSPSSSSPPKKELALVVQKGSPGKGEIRPISHKVENKVAKRRRGVVGQSLKRLRSSRKDDYESDSGAGADAGATRNGSRKVSSNSQQDQSQSASKLASFFSYLETHPQLPHLLSFYAQLLLNLFFIFGIMYIVYSFWSTIQSDVNEKSQLAMTETLAEMAVCAKHYTENRCGESTRVVPALEPICNEWKRCMQKDAKAVGRARVSAHTFAEIFNSFIEPISYKAMIFTLILIFGCLAVSNVAFGFFRNKALHNDPYMHAQMMQQQQPPPPTPQRHPSSGFDQYGGMGMGVYNTPHGMHPSQGSFHPSQAGWGLEPAPSGSQGFGPGGGSPGKSPSKSLEYR
ncbi:hypothetical protein EJ08DRAFT_619279 [Tothia fuscella]|uniref:Brl1/Brr6 domain-containing protein n=1 Tax=Tothia fuscella TaxID=1048955 RepID=A0A9P4NIA2_9PEZI|nr:hypothetical protein EJ08DRAFT_619279 [Tothia fuscella]